MSLRRLSAALGVAIAVLGPVPAARASATRQADAQADISPALDGIEVDGEAYREVASAFEVVRAVRRAAAARLVVLEAIEAELVDAVVDAEADLRRARAEVARWARRVADLAVEAYIGVDADLEAMAAGVDPTFTLPERRTLMTTEVDRHWQATLEDRRSEAAAVEAERDRLRDRRREVADDRRRTDEERVVALAEERRLWPEVRQARATATVVGSDLTLVALDAYLRAALESDAARPECGLPWWLLAGIGRVESGHGTFADSELDAAGTARPGITGIALDGSNGTAVIGDTDGGVHDGDPVSDRAVGPMQFIPSTWAAYAVDGNGDGVADPQNLYDAARAAADYLCTAGGDLRHPAGIDRAVFAYNHSRSYVQTVLGFAQEYEAFL